MNHTDELIDSIKKGLLGLNVGISTGLPKLDEIIAGVQKATIYNVAAGQGVGKSSLALYSFIYEPLKVHLNDSNYKIIYFSLELTAQILLAKLLSLYIYDQFQKEISFKKLMSRTNKSKLTQEEFALVEQSIPWLQQIEKQLIIYDKALTTDGMYAFLKDYSNKNGNWVSTPTGEIYTPNNPNEIVLVAIDHAALLKKKQGQSTKDAIDTACSELIYFRNKCAYSSLILQQLNRTSESMDRRKAEMQETELQDLKDSAGPSEAADVVLSIFYPHRSKMTTYRGYKIAQGFRDRFRSIVILKNRYGDADGIVPLNFFGSIGLFRELDEPNTYDSITDYSKYLYLFPSVQPTLQVIDPFSDSQETPGFVF